MIPRQDVDVRSGLAALRIGDVAGAARAMLGAVARGTNDVDAYCTLARIVGQQGNLDNAIFLLDRAGVLAPQDATVRREIGVALERRAQEHLAAARIPDALADFQRVLSLDDRAWSAANNLGLCLAAIGEHAAAVAAYRHALKHAPSGAAIPNNLALSLMTIGDWTAAGDAVDRALIADPACVSALTNRAVIYEQLGRFADAAETLRRALRHEPESAALHSNLGVILRELGLLADGRHHDDRAHDLEPANLTIRGNRLTGLLYDETVTPEIVADAHRAFGVAVASSVPSPAHAGAAGWKRLPALAADEPLRLGIVSPDLRTHSVAHFLLPLFRHRDPARLHVTAYADIPYADAVSERLALAGDRWRLTRGLPDDAVASLIADDQIHVLVDLAGHTRDNRMTLFARRVAPLQVSYLGYPATSGLMTMDARFTDQIADPANLTDSLHTETLLRLAGGFVAFDPLLTAGEAAPAVAPPPCLVNGFVTLGSFNNLSKVNDTVLRLWARILRGIPRSRLLLKWRSLDQEAARMRVLDVMAGEGIHRERIQLRARDESKGAHRASYGQIDVALDPFPYNGTTTTCEALYMGVPVVTLAGRAHLGRVGASLLGRVGLDDCVADSPDGYVDIATRLAGDTDLLVSRRANLRSRMEASDLMNGSRLALAIESTLRSFWSRRVA